MVALLFSSIYVIVSAHMLALESRVMESRNSRRPSPRSKIYIAINLMIWLGCYVKAFFKRISFCIIFGIHSSYLELRLVFGYRLLAFVILHACKAPAFTN